MKTNDEIRRKNLEIANNRVGSAAKLASLISTAPAYLSQIKNRTPDSKTGKPKSMGDEIARRIEIALGELVGWMDVEHVDTTASTQGLVDAVEEPRIVVDNLPPHLHRLDDAEEQLLTMYRLMGESWRKRLVEAAMSFLKISLPVRSRHQG